MKFISHRGNIAKPIPSLENHPSYIQKALDLEYDVEIDVWVEDWGVLFLGHDEPQYAITLDWLKERSKKLWIHCKNISSIEWFNTTKDFNYFWHQKDTVTLTSKNYIWAYPGMQPISNSIAVMPEINNEFIDEREGRGCIGVCSDYIKKYLKK